MIRLETKYRLWQGAQRKMLYDIYVEVEENLTYIYNATTNERETGVWMIETKIHDKRGKLLFEGDIVEGPNDLRHYIKHKDIFMQWMKDYNLSESDLLLIGNKFETPEKMIVEDSQE